MPAARRFLALDAMGLTDEEIADQLQVAQETVSWVRRALHAHEVKLHTPAQEATASIRLFWANGDDFLPDLKGLFSAASHGQLEIPSAPVNCFQALPSGNPSTIRPYFPLTARPRRRNPSTRQTNKQG
jgi:transcriptional regulator